MHLYSMIIDSPDFNDAVRQIQTLKKEGKGGNIIVRAHDPLFNRKIMERSDVSMLLSPEIHSRKDSLKQRDSGLNEFMCKLAKKNNIRIGIDIKRIQSFDKREQAIIISRLLQNIFLGKKIGCRFVLYPEGQLKKQDSAAILRVLGT